MNYLYIKHPLGITAEAVHDRLMQYAIEDASTLGTSALRFIHSKGLIGDFIQDYLVRRSEPLVDQIPLEDYREEILSYWDVPPGDDINAFLKETFMLQAEWTNGPLSIPTRPRAVTRDGSYLSIQAESTRACSPSTAIGPFTEVEVGYPSFSLDGGFDTDGDIFYHVPVPQLNSILKAHGGLSIPFSLMASQGLIDHIASLEMTRLGQINYPLERETFYKDFAIRVAAGEIKE